MKFDTIIIGGGLSGLCCGITLAKAGQRVAIVSAGQNTLHFNGGSMELLGNMDGTEVERPLQVIESLSDNHPYRKIGVSWCAALATEAQNLLSDAGIAMQGNAEQNHWRITPIGMTKPAWLSLDGMATSPSGSNLPWKHVTVLNLNGFIDLPIDFLTHNLTQQGTNVTIKDIKCDFLANARRSATEMRATNLARVLTSTSKVSQLAEAINEATGNEEVVLMPAVIGLDDRNVIDMLKAQVKAPLQFVATMPPSVPGTRMATLLKHYYKMLGGTYLMGDTACQCAIEDSCVKQINTAKLQDMPLRAAHYVLASGSFMSQGLMSTPERIYEPLFGLDVDAPADRENWSKYGLLGDQPFMGCGVVTDERFHAIKDGKVIANLYAIGAVLGGHNPVVMGDGTGVDMLTALAVAHHILQANSEDSNTRKL